MLVSFEELIVWLGLICARTSLSLSPLPPSLTNSLLSVWQLTKGQLKKVHWGRLGKEIENAEYDLRKENTAYKKTLFPNSTLNEVNKLWEGSSSSWNPSKKFALDATGDRKTNVCMLQINQSPTWKRFWNVTLVF